jgi:hypothetical protein
VETVPQHTDPVQINQGLLQLTVASFSSGASCCPDVFTQIAYRWNGSHFELVPSSTSRIEAGHVLAVKTTTPILDAQGHAVVPRCLGLHTSAGAVVLAGTNVVALQDSHLRQPGNRQYVYVAYPDPCQPGDDFSHNDAIANGSGAVGYLALSDLMEVQTVTPHAAFSNRGTAWRDCWGPTACGDATYPVEGGSLQSQDGPVLYAWWTGSYWDPHWWHVKVMQGQEAAVYGRDWTAT